jgi:hypothetical protein
LEQSNPPAEPVQASNVEEPTKEDIRRLDAIVEAFRRNQGCFCAHFVHMNKGLPHFIEISLFF